MRFSRFVALLLVLLTLILSVSLRVSGVESSNKSVDEFSSELEVFITDSFKYHTTVESPDGEEAENDAIINTNRLIVSTDSNEAIENTCGSVNCLEGFNNWHILQYASEDDTVAAYAYYSSQDYVNYVELDKIIEFEEEETNEETIETYSSDSKTLSWGSNKVESVNAINIMKKAKLGSQTVVAVIDSGVDSSHSFFIDESSKENRILDGNRPKDSAPDPNQHYYSHGTEVAGIIVDNTPANIKIKPYNYYYYRNGTTITLATEISSATNDGVDVINMSLGDYNESTMVKEAVRKAIEKGIVVVASAGNDGRDAYNHYPSNYPDVISVAAFNSSDKPWSNLNNNKATNYGSSIDISAPGSVINTTVPGGGYKSDGGTSMAAPFVSAAAAILKSANKNLSPARICEILKASAYKPRGWANNYASKYGAGIVNFKNMLRHIKMPAPTINIGNDSKIIITSKAGSNATYYYTTDGTTPTINSKKYSRAFSVPEGAISVKAIACVDNIITSSVAEIPIVYHEKITVGYKHKKELNLPDNARNINYIVENKNIASVENGKVYGIKPGETIVKVTMNANRVYYFHVSVEFMWWQFIHKIIYDLFGILI